MAVPINEAIKAVLGSGNVTTKLSAAEIEKFVDLYVGGTGNILYDEAGNVAFITTKSGLTYNFSTPQGAASEYVAANTLITDATYDAATQEITTTVGNVIDAGGSVTKKGLAAVVSTGAQVLSGAVTALGGVMTGVRWYQNNPEFWTDVSQKLLPFAYDDPTDKSWGDIFYDALFPTAMDSDGNTYVQEKDLELIKNILVNGGFFTSSISHTVNVSHLENHLNADTELILSDAWRNMSVPSSNTTIRAYGTSEGSRQYNHYSRSVLGFTGYSVKGGYSQPTGGSKKEDGTYKFAITASTKTPSESRFLYKPQDILIQGTNIKIYCNNQSSSLDEGPVDLNKATPPIIYVDDLPDVDKNGNVVIARTNQGSELSVNYIFLLMYIILYGNSIEKRLDNTSLLPDANYPSADKTLKDTYPDWYDNAVTTVNPNWNPKQPESNDNPKYIIWLPIQIPDAPNNADEGNTQPDATPDDAQSGKPTPNTNVGEKTDEAVDNGVLPNPYPETQPDTDSGNTGTTPNPPVDPTPTPDVPVISGGTANALWRIYNPSESVLQAFGKWLWSDNWVDIVKQLFANNPAEGIIGLHMIYVTPPVGGTSNIVVGYLDSGVASNWVSQQYVTIDCGTVQIPLYYQNALDYGYTKVYCYLPFIGIVPLDSYDIIGKSVNIKYTVDVLTGIVLAQISVMYGSYSAVLYTFNGSCSVEYPLTSGSRASQMLSLITGAVGGAVVGGVGGAILGGARGALTGADVRMSGNLAGNAGAMGIRKPYIIVKRPVEYAAAGYSEFYGNPANVTYCISAFSGYMRVKSVHISDIANATQAEKNEIENLLKSGVIVQ